MNSANSPSSKPPQTTAIENGFPAVAVSRVAERESWRKEINRPLYHIHKWWATRLGTIFRGLVMGVLSPHDYDVWQGFYTVQDFAGRIVLDPFMGSGTTLGEALKLGATAIGCDINPVSAFAVRQAFTHVSIARLRTAFARLEAEVAPEIRRYYQTRDPETGKAIPILYCFWVKTVTTASGEVIPLFSRYVFAQDAYPKKKPRAQIVCRDCWSVFEGRYDTLAVSCTSCGLTFNPQEGPAEGQKVTDRMGKTHRIKDLIPKGAPPNHKAFALVALRSSGEKVYLGVSEEDLALYAEAENRLLAEDLPLPVHHVRPGHNTDQARSYNYTEWSQFFNARQLLTLGLLLRGIMAIEEKDVREQLVCLFSSTLEFNNMFCSFKGEGTGAVRHMFSNHILKPERVPLENSVWGTGRSSGTFSTLFESRLLKAKHYLDEPFEVHIDRGLFGDLGTTSKVLASRPLRPAIASSWDELQPKAPGLLLLNHDSSHLPLPSKSVDAVVTDPPYFDFVHYSELSDFFYAWLATALKADYPAFARDDSSQTGEVQHKDPLRFAAQLGDVFCECCRVLKDEGTLTFSFHHSRNEGWAAINEAIIRSGMCIVAVHAVHGELRVSSPKSATTSPISLDSILVCRKAEFLPSRAFSLSRVLDESAAVAQRLASSGLRLSHSDLFVIAASQTLLSSACDHIEFDDMCARLDSVRQSLSLADMSRTATTSPDTSSTQKPVKS